MDKETFGPLVKNPNNKGDNALREPEEIIDEMIKWNKDTIQLISAIKKIM